MELWCTLHWKQRVCTMQERHNHWKCIWNVSNPAWQCRSWDAGINGAPTQKTAMFVGFLWIFSAQCYRGHLSWSREVWLKWWKYTWESPVRLVPRYGFHSWAREHPGGCNGSSLSHASARRGERGGTCCRSLTLAVFLHWIKVHLEDFQGKLSD